MCTVPQRERFDPPKVRRGFALRSQDVHRATARAISRSQSDVPATKSTLRLQSTAPATKSARKTPKYRACHETQPNARKCCACHEKASLPQTPNHPNCWPCHEIHLCHVYDTHRKLARDCGARMISTNFDMLQACQNEPIVRQGQRK